MYNKTVHLQVVSKMDVINKQIALLINILKKNLLILNIDILMQKLIALNVHQANMRLIIIILLLVDN